MGQGIERIIVSPYTRALQTTRPVAAALGVPVVVDPIVRDEDGRILDGRGTVAEQVGRARR